MVSEGMTITAIGVASGVSTTLVNLLISRKIKGRAEISRREVGMAMAAVAIGSTIGYLFIHKRRILEEVSELKGGE